MRIGLYGRRACRSLRKCYTPKLWEALRKPHLAKLWKMHAVPAQANDAEACTHVQDVVEEQ